MAEKVIIPGYRVESVLGYGGMSTVYLASQESLGRSVALKVMSSSLAHEAAYTKRFLKEARIIAQLNHPNIIVIYDYGVVDTQHFIAMEYLAGGSLVKKIQNRISVRESVEIIRDLSKALSFAHARGYIHRDIKPGNVLFREGGGTVLSDFGLAKGVSEATQLTATGIAMGTPAYMSPEQAYGDQVDARSDLYSLGCVFYYMLTGEKPYDAENPVALAMKHLKEPIPQLPHGLTAWQPIIDSLMAKNPDDRFQSAEELLEELETNSQEEPTPFAEPRRGPRGEGTAENLIDFDDYRHRSEDAETRQWKKQRSGANKLEVVEPTAGIKRGGGPATAKPVPVAEPSRDDLELLGPSRENRVQEFGSDPSRPDLRTDPSLSVARFRQKVREEAGRATPDGGWSPSELRPGAPQPPPPAQPAAGRSNVVIWVVVAAVVGTLLNTVLGFYLSSRGEVSDRSVSQLARDDRVDAGAPLDMERFSDPLASGGFGPEMVVVRPGEFRMGDVSGRYGSSARPVRTVTVPRSFAISVYEVTFDDYDRFTDATGRSSPEDRGWGRGLRPAIYVSWEDAQAYTDWLSRETGSRYRLPSEAEWEYAARGGVDGYYWWGARPSHEFANYGSDVCCTGAAQGLDRWQEGTAEVGSFAANGFGLFDTAGNVWEWVSDCWNVDHYGAPQDLAPRRTGDCGKRVVKGGSWSDIPRHIGSMARGRAPINGKLGFVGFRIAKDL